MASYGDNLQWVTDPTPATRIEKLKAQLWVARAQGNVLRVEDLHRQLTALGWRELKK